MKTPVPTSTSDRFNPILVREIRQMVRSRLVVTMINLYLFALVAITVQILLLFVDQSHSSGNRYGMGLFGTITALTVFVSLVVVVGHSALKVAADRINEDLLFFTTLKPGQNVRGRIVCGLVLSLLFFSMSLPFWVIAYQLRGVDLWMYFVYIPIPFLLIQMLNLVAVAVFSAVRSYLQFVFYSLLFLGIVVLLFVFSRPLFLGIYVLPYRSGGSYLIWHSIFHNGILLFSMLVFVPVTAWLFARCNLSPLSDNRMFSIRVWFSVFFLVAFFSVFVGDWVYDNFSKWFGIHVWMSEPNVLLRYWVNAFIAVLASMLVLAVCERETWEGRLRRSIPKSMFRRMLVFPFYTGSINGLFWVFFWTLCFAVGSAIAVLQIGRFQNDSIAVVLESFRLILFLMLVFDYSMTSFLLWKILLYRWVPRDMIWIITLGLIAAVSMASYFAVYLVRDSFGGIENGILLSANPFMFFMDHSFGSFQPVCAIFWFALVILFGYPWLRNRFLDFTPLEATPNIVSDDTI